MNRISAWFWLLFLVGVPPSSEMTCFSNVLGVTHEYADGGVVSAGDVNALYRAVGVRDAPARVGDAVVPHWEALRSAAGRTGCLWWDERRWLD